MHSNHEWCVWKRLNRPVRVSAGWVYCAFYENKTQFTKIQVYKMTNWKTAQFWMVQQKKGPFVCFSTYYKSKLIKKSTIMTKPHLYWEFEFAIKSWNTGHRTSTMRYFTRWFFEHNLCPLCVVFARSYVDIKKHRVL
jgi:hypothetical protein